jgi:excisionase family DNA binding protein
MPPETPSMTRRLLNIQEVADYTGLSPHTLYTMVSQRRIPFVKMGRLTKFDRYELDRWITSQSVKARRSFSVLTPLE